MRLNRRLNEPASLFVMRAYAACLDEMDEKELRAMLGWLQAKTDAVLKERSDSNLTTETEPG